MQIWENNDWLYECQHGFRQGYSCESQVITVCQDIADSLDEGVDIDAIIRGLLEKYPTFGREKETGLPGALDT